MNQSFLNTLQRIVGQGGFVIDPGERLTYECDALTHLREVPGAVVLPGTTEEIQKVVTLCNRERVPFVARGAGTGLSGGARPLADGLLIVTTRLNRILDIDIPNQRITVEPGVANLEVSRQVATHGLYYAPDPSSQQICSIGGNIAENSGGAHCLKYGFTSHHVLSVEAVLPNGNIVQIDGPALDAPGLDLLGVLIGSEGTLAIVTKATLRLLRIPEATQTILAAFNSTDTAAEVVSGIIKAGIIPAAVEMMDRLTIEAAEAAVHPGFPNAEAILIVELDGSLVEVEALMQRVEQICYQNNVQSLQRAQDEAERARIWKGRKAAFAAMGRVAPNYYIQDGVVPRTRLPEVLRKIRQLEADSGLRIGNVFHAGDGNLHPLICYDSNLEGQAELAERVATEILTYCIEAGGSITGEHGVGIDKAKHLPKMFNDDDLDSMQRVRRAFDPKGLCNPGKIFPTPRLCGEIPGPYREHPAERTGQAERF